MKVFAARGRAEALLRHGVLVWFLLTYIGAYGAVVVSSNSALILSSLFGGHTKTAIFAVRQGFLDGYTGGQSSMLLHASLALFALNVVLLGFYIGRVKKIIPALKSTGLGIGALVLLIVGAGCLSCGAIVGFALVSLFGAGALTVGAGVLTPPLFYGALVLLSISVVIVAKKVTDPFVC